MAKQQRNGHEHPPRRGPAIPVTDIQIAMDVNSASTTPQFLQPYGDGQARGERSYTSRRLISTKTPSRSMTIRIIDAFAQYVKKFSGKNVVQ